MSGLSGWRGSRDVLHELARRVERLMVSHRDPESFYVERSEIAAELRKISGSFPEKAMRGAKAREFTR